MHIREYRGTDETDLIALWNASMQADRISPSIFRTQVLLDANFQRDSLLVVLENETVVGFVYGITRQVPLYLHGLEPEHAWITAFGVKPEYRRQQIGTQLFERLMAQWWGEGRTQIEISPYVPNYFVPGIDSIAYPQTASFLQKLGFNVTTHAISMGMDLTGFQLSLEVQSLRDSLRMRDKINIRPVVSADIPDLLSFVQLHFGWDWFRHVQSYLMDEFGGTTHRLCILVAEEQGEIIGFCQQKNERFGPFGVHPDYRGKGIGQVLLGECLQAMSAQQVYYAYFLWTGEAGARLYQRVGFEERRRFTLFRKILL